MKVFGYFVALLLLVVPVSALEVVVTLPPLVEAVKAVSPAGTRITALIQPGTDPDSTSLSVGQIKAIASADLIVSSAQFPFEQQLALRCRQDRQLHSKLVELFETDSSAFAHHDDHVHHGSDPHFWLSVALYKHATQTISKELSKRFPNHAKQIQSNTSRYSAHLDQLNQTVSANLTPKKGRALLINHPSLGYLCEVYGITQLSIEQHGQTTSGVYLNQLMARAKKAKVKAVFVEDRAPTQQAKRVAGQLGVPVVKIRLMDPNYSVAMTTLAQQLSANL